MSYGLSMRILICPDSFGGTLTSLEAAQAIRDGWLSRFPNTQVTIRPLSDGGAGFVDSLAYGLGGQLHSVEVVGAFGESRVVQWLQVEQKAYFEIAQICGLVDSPLTPAAALSASSFGVGQILELLLKDDSISEINIGLGGSSVSDGGAGMLAALGLTSDVDLRGGAGALSQITELNRDNLFSTPTKPINFFADVEVPLTGKRGAAFGFSSQKGAGAAEIEQIEAGLAHFAKLMGRTADGKNPAVNLGAGAAGGLGYALMWLGAGFKSGIKNVIAELELEPDFLEADLIISGEGRLDWQSEVGKVITGVSELAYKTAKPLLAIVGQNDLSMRELQNLGIHGVFSAAEIFTLEESLANPAETLSKTAARAARTWGREQ